MKDRESTIAFEMNYCQHYKPLGANINCLAGVDIDKKFDSKTPGIFKRIPCHKGHEKYEDPTTECVKWVRRTKEMGEDRANRVEKSFEMLAVAFADPSISDWRNKEPIGKAGVIDCPVCKGKLHLSQAACNGHVHGKCETKDCLSWME